MWKDKKMWKMSIDVHGIVFCKLAISQCPGNVPLTGDFRSSETAWSRLGSRWNRNGSGAEFDVRHYECMRLSDEWCEWWVMSVHLGIFSSGVGRSRSRQTSNGGASRLSTVSLLFCSLVFTFGPVNPSGWWEWRATRGFLWHLSWEREKNNSEWKKSNEILNEFLYYWNYYWY